MRSQRYLLKPAELLPSAMVRSGAPHQAPGTGQVARGSDVLGIDGRGQRRNSLDVRLLVALEDLA